MNFIVECEQEEDGRWLAEVIEVRGALATSEEAVARADALARRVLEEARRDGLGDS